MINYFLRDLLIEGKSGVISQIDTLFDGNDRPGAITTSCYNFLCRSKIFSKICFP